MSEPELSQLRKGKIKRLLIIVSIVTAIVIVIITISILSYTPGGWACVIGDSQITTNRFINYIFEQLIVFTIYLI